MGLDTTIYFRASSGFTAGGLESHLPSGFSVRDIEGYSKDEFPQATHEIDTFARYYGMGYERGPWPLISAALMTLLATEDVEKVWYGNDGAGAQEITPDDVLRISKHYMANGHRPYRNFFQ